MPERSDRYTLITNVSYVLYAGVRLHVQAIVIATDRHPSGQAERQQVRMFGASPSWPVCDVDVPIVPYEYREQPRPDWMPDKHRLVWRRYDLRFIRFVKPGDEVSAISSVFEITTNMQDGSPLVVRDFPEGTSISQAWDALIPAVRQSWEAPYFPTLTFGPL